MKAFKITIVIGILLFASELRAQQLPLYSQYMQNNLVLNPAVAGTEEFAPLKTVIRSQWIGMEDQPNTQTISFHNRILDKSMGYGIYVFNDRIGPVSQTGVSVAYSYQIEFSENSMLSFGLSGQIYRYKLRTNQLQFDSQNSSDNVLTTGDYRAFYPNFSFGLLYKGENYYAGISVPELIENKITSSSDFFVLKKKRHYFLNAGYIYKINDTYTVEPSILFKYVGGAPPQLDINAKVTAYDKISLGVSLRTKDAIVLLCSYQFKERYLIGYAYDFTMSRLNNYSRGSHEIMLGVDLFKTKSVPKI